MFYVNVLYTLNEKIYPAYFSKDKWKCEKQITLIPSNDSQQKKEANSSW